MTNTSVPVSQSDTSPSCVLKQLPDVLIIPGAITARQVNPVNGVSRRKGAALGLTPQKIALLVSKYWGPKVDLGVKFLDNPDAATRAKILLYANKWGKYGNIKFRESSSGQIRLARQSGQGYYSYLGTDILVVSQNSQTMNLEAFTSTTPDSEYDRVVCHEFGHTLGFPHEHERTEILSLLDVEKTVQWFQAHYGWDRQTTMEQVFDPLNPADIQATAADIRSIMCYQFSGACTKSGQPIPGGNLIDTMDGAFVTKIYPPDAPLPPPPPPPSGSAVLTGCGISLEVIWRGSGVVGDVGDVKGTIKRNA